MATTKQQTPKPITLAQAFKLWMSGTGRSELSKQTGKSRGALRDAFVKLSGKTWSQLDAESGRAKQPAAKKSASKKVKAA